MTSTYNPALSKKLLLDPVGGYEWSLRADFAEAKAAGGLGCSADADLGQAIKCLLVGFAEPAEQLLKRAAEWVQIAIEAEERPDRYFSGATEAQRFHTLALCHWLLYDQHDAISLQQFVVQQDHYFNGQKRKDKVGVSLTLVTYVNAGAFERTLELFNSTPGLSVPTGLVPRNEAEMAYILCRWHLGLQFSQDDVDSATRTFLTKNLDTWLSNGQQVRAAEWLKTLHWNYGDHTHSAKQVMMKCYDYLPGRNPPH